MVPFTTAELRAPYDKIPQIMRPFQKISFPLALLLSLSYSAFAQSTVSDVQLMRLKGKVKSLVSSSKVVSGYAEGASKDTTKYQTTYLFDQEGRLTESIYEGRSNSRTVYSNIDGYKTFKTIVSTTTKAPNRFTVLGSNGKAQSIEPNEKLVAPDTRFDFRYVYETGDRGRIAYERQYQNNGKLFRKRNFEYNNAGVLIKEREEDSIAVMTYAYKYDDNGNVVEINKTRDIRGAGSDSKSRIVYTDFKFDSEGNWTERKATNNSKTDPIPQYNLPGETYTLVNIEYRTITYY